MIMKHVSSAKLLWTSDNEGISLDLASPYSALPLIRPNMRYAATLITTADHDDRVVLGTSRSCIESQK